MILDILVGAKYLYKRRRRRRKRLEYFVNKKQREKDSSHQHECEVSRYIKRSTGKESTLHTKSDGKRKNKIYFTVAPHTTSTTCVQRNNENLWFIARLILLEITFSITIAAATLYISIDQHKNITVEVHCAQCSCTVYTAIYVLNYTADGGCAIPISTFPTHCETHRYDTYTVL